MDCYKKVKTEYSAINNDFNKLLGKLELENNNLSNLNGDSRELGVKIKEFENEKQNKEDELLNRIKIKKDNLKKIIKEYKSKRLDENLDERLLDVEKKIKDSVKNQASLFEFKNKELNKLRSELSETVSVKNKIDVKIAQYQRDIENSYDKLDNLKGDRCPVCDSDLKQGAPVKYGDELYEKIKSFGETQSNLKKDSIKLRNKIREFNKKENFVLEELKEINKRDIDLEKLLKEKDEIKNKLAELNLQQNNLFHDIKQGKKEIKRMLGEYKNMENVKNPYIDVLDSINKKISKTKEKIKSHNKEKKIIAKKMAILEFWIKGFSNQGLPSFLMDNVIPYLTDRTNYYLGVLSDSDISINLTTQKELKSGEHRDKIGIEWIIEGISCYPPSGGQLKKMEIAVDLALMDLASNSSNGDLNFLAMDEILDGLDEEGKNRVVRLLLELKRNKETIFVITHDHDVIDSFQKMIVVEKTDGISKLRTVS